MNYEDFPILDDNTYKIMREQYNTNKLDKHEIIAYIFSKLNQLELCEIANINKLNKPLILALENSKNVIKNILDDFIKLFNLNKHQTNTIRTINIFSYINLINSIMQDLKKLYPILEKQFYKNFTNQTIDNLLNSNTIIFSALEHSNIYFFKYM